MLEKTLPLSKSGRLILGSEVYTDSILELSVEVSVPIPGHREYFTSGCKATALTALTSLGNSVGCPVTLRGKFHGNGTLVPDNSGTCQTSSVPWLSLWEVFPNITTYPSHPHRLSFRTLPNRGQVSRFPLCLNLHYSTYHSSKNCDMCSYITLRAPAWGAKRTGVLSLHFLPTTE